MNFPDPNVTTEYESPDGLKYVWNGFAWEIVCGGTPEVDLDPYLKKHGDIVDDCNAPPVFDWNKPVTFQHGPTSYNKSSLKLDNKKVVLEADDAMDVYAPNGVMNIMMDTGEIDVGGVREIAFTYDGVKLLKEIKSTTHEKHIVDKKYVDDDQKRQDAEWAVDQQRQDDEWAVDQKRQDDALAAEIALRVERDLEHDAEINTIEYKLDALVGLTFKGIYEFKHDQTCEEEYQECMANANDAAEQQTCLRELGLCEQNNVDPGFFEAVDPGGQFDNLQEIIISKNDKSNVEIDWAGVLEKDDYLEVDHVFQGQLDKTNYGLYRIMEEPETNTNSKGEVVYVMKLQFLQGDGVLNEKELYEIRGITAAEGVNPEELGDFLTKDEAIQLFAAKDHDHDDLTTTVSVHSTSTLSAGNNAKVTNMGDTKNANFKFEIPRGADGRNGSNGSSGSNGKDGKDLVMKTGTSTNPSLSKGEMYLNTSQKVLYIGVS